jgi:hypothetical protein
VLVYDEVTDRVQCHACGDWYRMLSGERLKRHGLTVAAYKERYGLPRTVRLESRNVTTSRRRNRELLAPRHVRPVAEDTLYGERGVLAYDELADHSQCHACHTRQCTIVSAPGNASVS